MLKIVLIAAAAFAPTINAKETSTREKFLNIRVYDGQKNERVSEADLLVEKDGAGLSAYALIGGKRQPLRGAYGEKLAALFGEPSALLTTAGNFFGYRQDFKVEQVHLSLDGAGEILRAHARVLWPNWQGDKEMQMESHDVDLAKIFPASMAERLPYRLVNYGMGEEPAIVLRELERTGEVLLVPARGDDSGIGGIYKVPRAFISLSDEQSFNNASVMSASYKKDAATLRRIHSLAVPSKGRKLTNPLLSQTQFFPSKTLAASVKSLSNAIDRAKRLTLMMDCGNAF